MVNKPKKSSSTIESILNDSGEMISIDEASQMVEEFYEEQDKSMNSLKKRNSMFSTPAKAKGESVKLEEPTVKTSVGMNKQVNRIESKQFVDNKTLTKTLTNKMSANTASIVSSDMTPEQNKQAIINKYLQMNRK